MLTRTVLSFIAGRAPAALLVALACGAAVAQGEAERIAFGRGQSASSVSGGIEAAATRDFVLYVRKGQRVTVRVTSENGKVEVDGSNISAGQFEERGHTSFSVPADETGDYRIYLRNFGRARTSFTLTVAVK